MVKQLCRFVSTACGIGYLPLAPGTWAAAVTTILWYLACSTISTFHTYQPYVILLLIFAGVYCSGKILTDGEQDPSHVVIDEVAGMSLTLLFVPFKYQFFLAGFIIFRFFDIVKPFGIKKMERFKKGWGIMSDDVLAGVYSFIVLQILFKLKVW